MTTANGKTTENGKAKRRSGRNAQKERKWQGLIARQRRSGRTVKAFCEARGLSESLFYYWRGQLEGAGGEKSEKSGESRRKRKRAKTGAVIEKILRYCGL